MRLLGLRCLHFSRWVINVSQAAWLCLGIIHRSRWEDVIYVFPVEKVRCPVPFAILIPRSLFMALTTTNVPHDERQSSEKQSFGPYRSTSWTQSESSIPENLVRRNSLASLSVAADLGQVLGEQKWPTGWRPYTCLLGGFLLMFNSWGLVSWHHPSQHYVEDSN